MDARRILETLDGANDETVLEVAVYTTIDCVDGATGPGGYLRALGHIRPDVLAELAAQAGDVEDQLAAALGSG
ncbi:hypothetical protein ACFOGJ_24320 [Marinibaculum pumilum]|uniref:Uncharacterized protein n=1 Tax=Marinibaculum pumilum TaxID=1766165 RepID=A0ABV7L6Z0_9PROT